jgi:signal transduction histidine kinase
MGIQLITSSCAKALNFIENCIHENLFSNKFATATDEIKSILDIANLINESCNVALETLNDLLTFDKIDESKLILELKDTNPWTMLCETMNPFKINAGKADIELTSACCNLTEDQHTPLDSDEHWLNRYKIIVDQFKLKQVLRNLISNALKFTPPNGKVKVSVDLKANDNNSILVLNKDCVSDIFVRLSVADNGCGISLQNQKKLFGQYVQFDANALQQGKGSGLGLWISKSIFIFLFLE